MMRVEDALRNWKTDRKKASWKSEGEREKEGMGEWWEGM